MSNIIDYVKDLDVPIEETIRTNCPSCNSYKTFTVTNNMGTLVWNCYKASCNLSGGTRVRLSVDDIKGIGAKKAEAIANTFTLPEYIVPHNNRKNLLSFCTKWKLDADKHDLHYDVREDRVVFPIVHKGTFVDATGRSLGNRIPKWKRYGNNLGTSLSEEHKKFLSQFSTAIIALDPDALPKIFLFAKELRGYVDNVHVLRLQDDIKYLKADDLINLHNLTPKEKIWN